MSNFDEKSAPVTVATDWGRWWQTTEEVQLEMDLDRPATAKQCRCNILPTALCVRVCGTTVVEGRLFDSVKPDDSTWTLEDGNVLRVLLCKVHTGADRLWPSLLDATTSKNAYAADFFTKDEMQKKLTLERMQRENPGMDFSGADITGNYQKGGPNL